MQKIKKIAIIGLGPVGMVLAVHLKNAGHNIALFVRSEEKKEVIEKLKQSPVRKRKLTGKRKVKKIKSLI